ncbi:probable ATP-dependent RNA helicase kurz [Saccostrea cucullata]|uniref:probable ATP-dependent RNA helicase kurz n=1 Tax=Saccostrea cuccullata TaxID=36930 RepID=UPI002ED61799
MGKRKHVFNWKARQQNTTVQDKSDGKKIKLDLDAKEIPDNDDTNVLVLPSKKRNVKAKQKTVAHSIKQLSKKERKKLEKVIEQKEKKSKRADLLESLSAVQATPEELQQLSSIADVQTGKFQTKWTPNTVEKGRQSNTVVGGYRKKTEVNIDEDSSDDSESSVHTSEISSEEEEQEEEQEEEEREKEDKQSNEEDIAKSKDENSRKHNVENGSDLKMSEEVKITDVDFSIDKANKKLTEQKPVVNIQVNREPEIQEARFKLPILAEEQMIMETINENNVVIICGETGSGKTTQVPQFLYEAGYAHAGGIIAVTEPRRVAAISMSQRVGAEMNLTSREVSYQIRYEGNVTESTKIKFMTDGVLLKEVQKDFLLTKYSVVIIDEAHERSVYTDILIGLLSRITPLRHKRGIPLKLIIMSATLKVEDFTENPRLFKTVPPVVKVNSRQFPVTIHFNKRTPVEGYLLEAYRKVNMEQW